MENCCKDRLNEDCPMDNVIPVESSTKSVVNTPCECEPVEMECTPTSVVTAGSTTRMLWEKIKRGLAKVKDEIISSIGDKIDADTDTISGKLDNISQDLNNTTHGLAKIKSAIDSIDAFLRKEIRDLFDLLNDNTVGLLALRGALDRIYSYLTGTLSGKLDGVAKESKQDWQYQSLNATLTQIHANYAKAGTDPNATNTAILEAVKQSGGGITPEQYEAIAKHYAVARDKETTYEDVSYLTLVQVAGQETMQEGSVVTLEDWIPEEQPGMPVYDTVLLEKGVKLIVNGFIGAYALIETDNIQAGVNATVVYNSNNAEADFVAEREIRVAIVRLAENRDIDEVLLQEVYTKHETVLEKADEILGMLTLADGEVTAELQTLIPNEEETV